MPKSNCGQTIYRIVDCSDCHDGLKSYCLKCNNIILHKKILDLQNELSFLKKEYDNQFNIEPYLIHKYIKQHLEPVSFLITPHTFFVTITFDPSRFQNLGVNSNQEETYILHQLSKAIKNGYIFGLYGCFELTAQSITHSHINIYTYQPFELKQFLKEQFTFNMRNRHAVDVGKANLKSTAYIDKIEDGKGTENKTWFTYTQPQNPLDNII